MIKLFGLVIMTNKEFNSNAFWLHCLFTPFKEVNKLNLKMSDLETKKKKRS